VPGNVGVLVIHELSEIKENMPVPDISRRASSSSMLIASWKMLLLDSMLLLFDLLEILLTGQTYLHKEKRGNQLCENGVGICIKQYCNGLKTCWLSFQVI
jgi:hypothetical protein